MHSQEFRLHASRHYLILLGIVFFLSASIIFMLPLYLLVKFSIFVVLFIYMGWITQRFCLLKLDSSIIVLRFISGNKWLLITRQGDINAELLGDSTVTRWVSVLRFRVDGHRFPQSSIVFRDSLPEGVYRKLIVIANAG